MSYRGSENLTLDFKGGQASNRFSTNLEKNQAILLRNIYINSGGGIEKRRGDTTFNSSAMVGDTTPVTGLGYFKLSTGTDYLVAVAGTKIFKADSLDGTMDDITGAVTITSGQNNIWTHSQMNDLSIWVGGAPDAPIKWSGSGNAAALAGSPVSANFGFTNSNRLFLGNTAANPSRIYWSVLGDPEDWAGAGSGNQDVAKNDGDTLVGAATLSDDVVLLFKQRSVHKLIGRGAPFPVFPLFSGVGAVGKKAIVTVDGTCYFLTQIAGTVRMKATDGNSVVSFPSDMDNVFNGLNASRVQYATGVHYTGVGFDHLVWIVSNGSSTTNNLAIVWDLVNKCWLQHTSGYDCNVVAKTQSGVLYGGHYNGKIYKKDVASTYTDASEATPGAIDALWRSGWMIPNSFQVSFQPSRLNIGLTSQTAGTLTVGYGFDFATDNATEIVSMLAPGMLWDVGVWDVDSWGGQSDLVRTIFIKGRGNAFQVTFSNNTASQNFQIHGWSLSGKKSASKLFQVT